VLSLPADSSPSTSARSAVAYVINSKSNQNLSKRHERSRKQIEKGRDGNDLGKMVRRDVRGGGIQL
jgi:hypothetical protein